MAVKVLSLMKGKGWIIWRIMSNPICLKRADWKKLSSVKILPKDLSTKNLYLYLKTHRIELKSAKKLEQYKYTILSMSSFSNSRENSLSFKSKQHIEEVTLSRKMARVSTCSLFEYRSVSNPLTYKFPFSLKLKILRSLLRLLLKRVWFVGIEIEWMFSFSKQLFDFVFFHIMRRLEN